MINTYERTITSLRATVTAEMKMSIALAAFEKNWTTSQVAEKFGISVREADRCKKEALEILRVKFSGMHSEMLSRERQHLDELFCKACQKDFERLQDEQSNPRIRVGNIRRKNRGTR